LLSVCIDVPAIILSFLGINLRNIMVGSDGLPFWLALLIGIVGGECVAVAILWFLRRQLSLGKEAEATRVDLPPSASESAQG